MSRGRVVSVAFLSTLLLSACGKREDVPHPPLTNVVTPKVDESMKPPSPKVPNLPEMVATIQGGNETAVKATQSGYLVRQVYKDGSTVAAGDVLFLLDPRTTHDESSTDKAALVRIVSPMAGFPGFACHGAGDRIEPGMELVGVARMDEVYAEVSLPEPLAQQFADYFAQRATASARNQPAIELILPDGHVYGEKGAIGGMASAGGVNVLSIMFSNSDHLLQPGEFVRVRSAP